MQFIMQGDDTEFVAFTLAWELVKNVSISQL